MSMVVLMKLLQISKEEQIILLPPTAKILNIEAQQSADKSGRMFLQVYYLSDGSAMLERRCFWTVNTGQIVDDETYGPFTFITAVTTPRGLVHVFERHT